MRAFFRKTAFALLLLFAVGGSLVLDFFLPEHTTTLITGTEVKLADKDGPISKQNPADQPLRDVYLIYTQHAIDDVRVYRNEDTGWGWPFYFKFDSSDVQATALALQNAKQPAYITTYGWRINMFSQYPNITAIRLAVAGENTWCAVRWLAFALWAVLLMVLGRLAWRLTRPLVKDGDVIG